MARFAIVHWEDHFVSLINLETVKEPRKPVLEYREGEFITATYGKKPYKARISEISTDRASLQSKSKDGKFPLKYTYSDDVPVVEGNLDKSTVSTSRQDEEEATDSLEPEVVQRDVQRNYDSTSDLSTINEEMPPVGESTPDTDTTASDVVDTTVEMPLQVTPEAKRHSRSPTPPSLSSKVRKLEKKYEALEREVRHLKKKLRASVADVAPHTVPGPSSSPQAASDGPSVEELLQCVSHLSSKDVGIILRTLVYKVFENEDLLNCSRTGKKTVNSRDNPKPPLNAIKLEIVQTAIMRKCEISVEVFKKKFDNFLKMERRKSRVASSQMI
ncbi:uncharacterized protein LOC128159627 [Crassostrea angulata]|uniref:uncharacterized protein LOC128159627 n=1 Tax=Magallana angulata TaxID=2784310 RepID=UPI00148A24F9|nr:uncharacterized protein LOC105332205 [Crassostrea gigas]XP_052678733.1 uncharacterized protein LOC128159627 [Crassostrea angulata]